MGQFELKGTDLDLFWDALLVISGVAFFVLGMVWPQAHWCHFNLRGGNLDSGT